MMPTVKECLCCRECPETLSRMESVDFREQQASNCITDVPFIEGAILNPWGLERACRMEGRHYGGPGNLLTNPE